MSAWSFCTGVCVAASRNRLVGCLHVLYCCFTPAYSWHCYLGTASVRDQCPCATRAEPQGSCCWWASRRAPCTQAACLFTTRVTRSCYPAVCLRSAQLRDTASSIVCHCSWAAASWDCMIGMPTSTNCGSQLFSTLHVILLQKVVADDTLASNHL